MFSTEVEPDKGSAERNTDTREFSLLNGRKITDSRPACDRAGGRPAGQKKLDDHLTAEKTGRELWLLRAFEGALGIAPPDADNPPALWKLLEIILTGPHLGGQCSPVLSQTGILHPRPGGALAS